MNNNYENSTVIVTMNDSLIQSLSKNANKDNEIMANYVSLRLQREGYENLIPIDCGSLTLNKQHNVSEFLKNNLSRAEIKATQIASIDAARKGAAKLRIPLSMKKNYGINGEDYDIHIADAIKYGENVGVVLSSIANDLMLQGWVDPKSCFLGSVKQEIPFMESKTLKRLRILLSDEKLRNNVIDGYKRNIEEILGINYNAKIITMGIFRPKITPAVSNNFFEEVNFKIENVATSYDQSYVDISDIKSKLIDSQPTGEDYMLMQERVADEVIRRFNQNNSRLSVPEFIYSNLGLNGAIEQIRESIPAEKEYIDKLISEVIHTYSAFTNEPKKEVEHFMKPFIEGRIDELQTHMNVYEAAERLLLR